MKTLPKQQPLDTNVLVALVDSHDKWHARAIALRDALKAEEVDVVYFDPVINEAVSVLARRSEEQKRSEQFGDLLNTLMQQVSVQNVTWLSSETLRLYEDVLDLVRRTSGRMNFHDALIALGCKELGIQTIVSFDKDFDEVDWLTRVDTPTAVSAVFQPPDKDKDELG